MNLLEKSEISCEDYYEDDSELVEKINQNSETQIDYTKLIVYFMVFVCLFLLSLF